MTRRFSTIGYNDLLSAMYVALYLVQLQTHINQSKSLIAVAQRVLDYRTKELKIQEDKQAAGLNLKTDILSTKAQVAKANADVYAAQLAYTLAVSELKSLIGN